MIKIEIKTKSRNILQATAQPTTVSVECADIVKRNAVIVGRSFQLRVFEKDAQNLEFCNILAADSEFRNFGYSGTISDGFKEVKGFLVFKKYSKKDGVFDLEFKSGGFDWLNSLPPLCELDLGATIHSGANILTSMQDVAPYSGGTGSAAIWHHSIYFAKPQNTYFTIEESHPSIYVTAVFNQIAKHITDFGYAIDAPFFQTEWAKRLLLHYPVDLTDLGKNKNFARYELKSATYFPPSSVYSGGKSCFLPLTGAATTGVAATYSGDVLPSNLGSFLSYPQGCANSENPDSNYFKIKIKKEGVYEIFGYFKIATISFSFHRIVFFKNGIFLDEFSSASSVVAINQRNNYHFEKDDEITVGVWFSVPTCSSSVHLSSFDFKFEVNSVNVISNNTLYGAAGLLPCGEKSAADFLQGIARLFNLVIFTDDDNTVTIAPMFDVELPTGEKVDGFFRRTFLNLNEVVDIDSNSLIIDNSAIEERVREYLFSFGGNDLDINIKKGQLFSQTHYEEQNPNKQKSFDNSYFVPTYSVGGTCFLLPYNYSEFPTNETSPNFNMGNRLLYKHGHKMESWQFNGATLNFKPCAFMADLENNYLNFGGENNLINIFWLKYLKMLQSTFNVNIDLINEKILFSNTPSLRGVYKHEGGDFVIQSLSNLTVGENANTGGSSVKILKI